MSPAPTTSVRAISFWSRSFRSPSFQSISFRTTSHFKQPHSTQPHIPNGYVSRDFIPNDLIYNKRLQSKTNSYSRKTSFQNDHLQEKKKKASAPTTSPLKTTPYIKSLHPQRPRLKRPPPKASHAAPIPPRETDGRPAQRETAPAEPDGRPLGFPKQKISLGLINV